MAETIPITRLEVIKDEKQRKQLETILADVAKFKVQKKEAEKALDDNKVTGDLGLVSQAANLMQIHQIRKTEVDGFIHRLQPGCNVYYSKDQIMAALNRRGYLVEEIVQFLEEVKVETPFTTIITAETKEEEIGGVTKTKRRK